MTAQDKPHIPRVDINAVYEDGVLKPERALDLPEGARLRVTVRLGTAAPSQRTRIGRQVVALAAAVRSTLAAMSHQILARIDGLAAAKVPLFAASAAAVIAGGWLLVEILRVLQLGILGDLDWLWGVARAGRHFVDLHRRDLSIGLIGGGLVAGALWLYRCRRAGVQPAAFALALGLGLAGELLILDELFRPGAAALAGSAGVLLVGVAWGQRDAGTALEPVRWTARRERLLLLLILTIAIVTRFHLLGQMPYGIEGDESSWALQVADSLTRDGGPRIGQFSPMPTSYWMQGLFYRIFGINIVAARLEVAVFSIVGTVLFYVAVRAMVNVPVALMATFLLSVSLIDLAASRQAHVEAHIKVWIMLAVLGLVLGYQRRQLRFFLLAGAGLAMGLMVYDNFALAPTGLFAYAVFRLIRERQAWRRHLTYLVAMSLPVLAVAYPVWTYLEGRRISQLAVLSTKTGVFPGSADDWVRMLPRLLDFAREYAVTTARVLTYQQGQDVLIGRPGPLESAAILPFVVLGLIVAGWYWRRRQVAFALFWVIVPVVPTTLLLGQPFARTFYPFLGGLQIFAAVALWVMYDTFREGGIPRRLRWLPTAALVTFLAVVGVSNTYAYFNEVRDPEDRKWRRELGELLTRHVAPGDMLYLPYLPLRDDFLQNEWRYPRFVVRDRVPLGREDELYKTLPYTELLPAISAVRDRVGTVKVFYDRTVPQPGVRREVLNAFERCYPNHTIDSGRYFDVYIVGREGLATARCYSHAEVTAVAPVDDEDIVENPPFLAWQVASGNQSGFRLELQRHNDQVTWLEAEAFSEENGWQAQAHLTDGFTGWAYLADTAWAEGISAAYTVDIQAADEYEIWIRSYRRVDDRDPIFLRFGDTKLEFARVQPDALNHWRWESLGWHALPSGPQKLVLTREFPGDPPWQIFVDSVVLSRQADFDPGQNQVWAPAAQTDEIRTSRREWQLAEHLLPGRYRWHVTIFDEDRLVDWRGRRGITSEYAYFRIPE